MLTKHDSSLLMGQLFVSYAEAAQLLRISRSTLYRMRKAGEVPVQYYRERARIPVWWIKEQAGIAEQKRQKQKGKIA